MSTTSKSKLPITLLSNSPLSPPLQLPPDPLFPSLSSFRSLTTPSPDSKAIDPTYLRRARIVKGCFTWCDPLPMEFPYRLPEDNVASKEEEQNEGKEDGSKKLEKYFTSLHLSSSERRSQSPFSENLEVLAISNKLVDEMEILDIGEEGSDIRKEFLEVVSGRRVMIDEGKQIGPWAMCYGGIQFGHWAGQLGDGRAHSILCTPSCTPHNPSLLSSFGGTFPTLEFQLKGSGRTPYSRFADGLATLRGGVREFLGAEAVAGLNISTVRSLSLVLLPSLKALREISRSQASILCRVAPSFLRVGNFELMRKRQDWENLRALIGLGAEVLSVRDGKKAEGLFREATKRNAEMVAGWQAYGFMHGVLNTDNTSILGLTIDYGPYAFMDVFDPNHCSNSEDEEGRYSFKMQPTVIAFNLSQLGITLFETIGYERLHSGEMIPVDWKPDEEELEKCKKAGAGVVEDIKADFSTYFIDHYKSLMTPRFGLRSPQETDFLQIFSPFLDLLEGLGLDMNKSFRNLNRFTGVNSIGFEEFLEDWVDARLVPKYIQRADAKAKAKDWFVKYELRLTLDQLTQEERRKILNAANPSFVLRQWILENIIKKLERPKSDEERKEAKELLEETLRKAEQPFRAWDEEGEENKRFCDVGDEYLRGYMCDCAS